MKTHYPPKRARYPKWTYTAVKYYGPNPVRYPDIAEKIFDDHETDEEERERFIHDADSGHDARSIWRSSKNKHLMGNHEPALLLSVNADKMREKIQERTEAK